MPAVRAEVPRLTQSPMATLDDFGMLWLVGGDAGEVEDVGKVEDEGLEEVVLPPVVVLGVVALRKGEEVVLVQL